jgi:transposase
VSVEQEKFINNELSSRESDQYSREELLKQNKIMKEEIVRLVRELYELRQIKISDEQLKLITSEQLAALNDALYGASSERYKRPENKKKKEEPAKPRVKKPSERYPNIPVREVHLTIDPAPGCEVCGKQMSDSGMTEDSEVLTVIPKKFEIIRYMRSIYRCSCQSCMRTAPVPAKIVEGSSYSNEMILDVVLSKYCDLIPIERYAQMAARGGLMDLPPHSLIDLTHKFAFFVKEVYRLIKLGVMSSRVLNADETPHRMLEGSNKKSWYLWGFSTLKYCYLECHDTRSGDIASDVLLNSLCEILLTDVYSGYNKATRLTNIERQAAGKKLISNANCNAHARRYFFKARVKYPEANFYMDQFHEIYQLNSESKGKPPDEVLEYRTKMRSYFEAMKARALEELPRYPNENHYKKALDYFLKNYKGLTLFLGDPEVPIDNNAQERLLRSHVVGRKTWYGTHSEQGAETAAILFSIVETCKLNDVNPREYFEKLVQDLLAGKKAYTPSEYKEFAKS